MASRKAVVIDCEQTGEQLILKQGDPIGEYAHRAFPRRFEFGNSPVIDAWVVAGKLGWRSFSMRDASGFFREVPSPRDEFGRPRNWRAGAWVVAPGVEPDPPYSQTALDEIARRERDAARAAEWSAERESITEQVDRLRAEIDRLQNLGGGQR